MTDHIDEFESLFRRAEKERFVWVPVPFSSVTIVTDGSSEQSRQVQEDVCRFIPRLQEASEWRLISGQDYRTVSDLLQIIDDRQTDLLITYRHLQEASLIPQHSLGVYLDVLTQTTSLPVLVLPGCAAEPIRVGERDCDRVMVVADHISGDNRLINYGTAVCRPGGTLWLCHIEDDRIFQRYMNAISRIPEIHSEQARTLIEAQLLREASDFIDECARGIRSDGPNIRVEKHVGRGHHLRDYRRLIQDHDIDVLVFNTKDDDQLAMNGRAYSLSVELTDVAMLML